MRNLILALIVSFFLTPLATYSNAFSDSTNMKQKLISALSIQEIKSKHDNKKYEQIIRDYEPILEHLRSKLLNKQEKIKVAKALHYIASAFYRTDQLEKAIEYEEWSIELNPNDTEVWLDLGTGYKRMGEKTGVKDYIQKYKMTCEKVIERAPPNSKDRKKAERRLKKIMERLSNSE